MKEDKETREGEGATRYVYVEGVPLDSNEQDIKSLFHVRPSPFPSECELMEKWVVGRREES